MPCALNCIQDTSASLRRCCRVAAKRHSPLDFRPAHSSAFVCRRVDTSYCPMQQTCFPVHFETVPFSISYSQPLAFCVCENAFRNTKYDTAKHLQRYCNSHKSCSCAKLQKTTRRIPWLFPVSHGDVGTVSGGVFCESDSHDRKGTALKYTRTTITTQTCARNTGTPSRRASRPRHTGRNALSSPHQVRAT